MLSRCFYNHETGFHFNLNGKKRDTCDRLNSLGASKGVEMQGSFGHFNDCSAKASNPVENDE